jgi:hypothetical protein
MATPLRLSQAAASEMRFSSHNRRRNFDTAEKTPRHSSDLTQVHTVIPNTAQKGGSITGNSLIQNQAQGGSVRQRCFPLRCLKDSRRRMPAPA